MNVQRIVMVDNVLHNKVVEASLFHSVLYSDILNPTDSGSSLLVQGDLRYNNASVVVLS